MRLGRASGQNLNNQLWRASSVSKLWALRVGQSASTALPATLAEARWSIGLFEGAWALAMHTVRGSAGAFDYAEHATKQFAGLKNEPR